MTWTVIPDIFRKKYKFGKKYLVMHIMIRAKTEMAIINFDINIAGKIEIT